MSLLQPPVPRMTGREAVEYFTKAYHLGKIEYMYFNIDHNRCYRPYDLVSVTKYKVAILWANLIFFKAVQMIAINNLQSFASLFHF